MEKPNIVNIQKYSIHDGDGIRTTVFFKGCALRCWWCHNPESQSYEKEPMINYEKCTDCGACQKHCSHGAIKFENGHFVTDASKCVGCAECTDFCILNNREVCGTQYEIKDLMKIIDKDKDFYEQSGGGVTLSGGEVMSAPIEYLETLCKRIKAKGYDLCIDTCGFAPTENYVRIAPYVDTFLYDIKVIDDEIHKKYVGQSNELILKNLETINELGANINIRIPIVVPVNDDDKSIADIIQYLKDKNIQVSRVNLLPYHNTGSSKYEKLRRPYLAKDCQVPSKDKMEKIKSEFEKNGFSNVKIGG